jgi:hypothetical protein
MPSTTSSQFPRLTALKNSTYHFSYLSNTAPYESPSHFPLTSPPKPLSLPQANSLTPLYFSFHSTPRVPFPSAHYSRITSLSHQSLILPPSLYLAIDLPPRVPPPILRRDNSQLNRPKYLSTLPAQKSPTTPYYNQVIAPPTSPHHIYSTVPRHRPPSVASQHIVRLGFFFDLANLYFP